MSKKENRKENAQNNEYYVILRGFKYVNSDGEEVQIKRSRQGERLKVELLPQEAVEQAESIVFNDDKATPIIRKAKKSEIPGGYHGSA